MAAAAGVQLLDGTPPQIKNLVEQLQDKAERGHGPKLIVEAPQEATFASHAETQELWGKRCCKQCAVATPSSCVCTVTRQKPCAHCRLARVSSHARQQPAALARDQKGILNELFNAANDKRRAHLIVGDVSREERDDIMNTKEPRVLCTSPDMLHWTLLPMWSIKWAPLFESIAYVGIDEVHTYTGNMAAHVANVIARLMRIVEQVRGHLPQVYACSATVRNPLDMITKLTGLRAPRLEDHWRVIEDSGAAHPGRVHAFVDTLASYQMPAAAVAADMCVRFVQAAAAAAGGLQCLMFCTTCEMAEKVTKQIKSKLPSHLQGRVEAFRGTYPRQQKEQRLTKFMAGAINLLVSTNALEPGINIGNLRLVIRLGMPWALTNYRQQSGRAGRTGTPGTCIVLADENITKSALNLYYLGHPEEYLQQALPELVFDPSLPPIRNYHINAAARELPLRREDAFWFGPGDKFLEWYNRKEEAAVELNYVRQWLAQQAVPGQSGSRKRSADGAGPSSSVPRGGGGGGAGGSSADDGTRVGTGAMGGEAS